MSLPVAGQNLSVRLLALLIEKLLKNLLKIGPIFTERYCKKADYYIK